MNSLAKNFDAIFGKQVTLDEKKIFNYVLHEN